MYALVHTLMIFFRCFCMVSQLPCQMIRWSVPICSRFPGIDLLPNRATSAISKSSELLLDLQVGFNAHVGPLDVVFLEEATSFWIVPLFWEQSNKNRIPFFGARFLRQKLWNRLIFKNRGRWTWEFPWIFRGTSVRNMAVEPSEAACDSSRVKRTSTRSSEAGGPIFLVSLGRFSCPLEIFFRHQLSMSFSFVFWLEVSMMLMIWSHGNPY